MQIFQRCQQVATPSLCLQFVNLEPVLLLLMLMVSQ